MFSFPEIGATFGSAVTFVLATFGLCNEFGLTLLMFNCCTSAVIAVREQRAARVVNDGGVKDQVVRIQ